MNLANTHPPTQNTQAGRHQTALAKAPCRDIKEQTRTKDRPVRARSLGTQATLPGGQAGVNRGCRSSPPPAAGFLVRPNHQSIQPDVRRQRPTPSVTPGRGTGRRGTGRYTSGRLPGSQRPVQVHDQAHDLQRSRPAEIATRGDRLVRRSRLRRSTAPGRDRAAAVPGRRGPRRTGTRRPAAPLRPPPPPRPEPPVGREGSGRWRPGGDRRRRRARSRRPPPASSLR